MIAIYVARAPALPGCIGGGKTPSKAIDELVRSAKVVMESMIETGTELPQAVESVSLIKKDGPKQFDTLRRETRQPADIKRVDERVEKTLLEMDLKAVK